MENKEDVSTNTVEVKQNLSWYIVESYLEHIENLCDLFEDNEFEKLYIDLKNLVNSKINVPNDIVNICVLVEHTIGRKIQFK